MNRKLIRTTLADLKDKGREITIQKRASGEHRHSGGHDRDRGDRGERGDRGDRGERDDRPRRPMPDRERRPMQRPMGPPPAAAVEKPSKRKLPPPTDTSAEYYYYKKQIDAQTQMVIVLKDGEQIEGTLVWYDRNALKINRADGPNLMLLKHNVKYMFKAEERENKE